MSNWRFPRQVWLYLGAVFCFGLTQALFGLYLNFYLASLGMGAEWQGLLNALPALSSAALCVPAVAIAKRYSNANTLKIGASLAALGMVLLVSAQGPALALLGMLLQGSGGALTMVAGSPFLANNSGEDNRVTLFSLRSALMMGSGFFGSLLGGQIPFLYSQWAQVGPSSSTALRVTLVVACGLHVLGALLLWGLRPSGKVNQGPSLHVSNWPRLLSLTVMSLLVGLGAGATIPFLNVFIEGKFGISYRSLGGLFALSSLATAAAILLQPLLVRHVGQLRAVILVQLSSLPFLFMLGFAPALWMVTVALMTRGALMNAASPVYDAFAMTALPEEDRPMFSAISIMMWNGGWALSSIGSGLVRGALPFADAFHVLFGWTIAMYSLSVVFLYWRYGRARAV